MIINVTTLDSGLSISQTNGAHSSSNCCSGFAYMITMELGDSPSSFRFRKEMTHPNYFTDPKTGQWTHPKCNFKIKGHGNVGVCFVKYDKKDGISSGHDSVICEFWFNPDPDNNPLDWTMLKRTEDKGKWGSGGDHCNGNSDQVGAWAGGKHRIKSNGSGNVVFKHVSLREIDPTAGFDDNPPDDSGGGSSGGGEVTTTTEVQGLLTLKRDINVYRTSACDPTGSVAFYNSADSGDSIILGSNPDGTTRTRVGIYAANSSSMLINQPPLQEADFYLSKVGSPTGTLTCVIRSGSNDVIKATMDTIDVATDLTTTPTLIQFINLSNTYVMQAENKILVEWSGGDTSNYVVVQRRTTKTVADVNTWATSYRTDLSPDQYDFASSKEISGILWN